MIKKDAAVVINGPQIRAARGFLAWDRRDLTKKAVVTIGLSSDLLGHGN
jgi:hypothetical protein